MKDKEIYSEIRRVLSNVRSIRIFAHGTNIELLKGMHEKLGKVIKKFCADEEKKATEYIVHEEKRKELVRIVENEGFTVESLLETNEKNKKKIRKILKTPAKYEFTEDNKIKTWTGKGRKPKLISEALNSGRNINEFLIKKNS